ncbi:hypothetical protein [Halocynthiibacter namhaensis]|uniref:hypothetical protein n=1 Tax=Halocynthiibacter namhaensis TaxID=1290553 RepID=UPI0012E056DA|nr:hypothetical protein [Halocynthiibacter namhaensis]
MIKAKDINDAGDLKLWLTQFPTETQEDQDYLRSISIQIAHRAAARVLPLEWQFEGARKSSLNDLLFLRCNLISGGAGAMPPKAVIGFGRAVDTVQATYAVHEGYDTDPRILSLLPLQPRSSIVLPT